MDASESSIKEVVRKFIGENYFAAGVHPDLRDDDSFLQKGIIDSIGVIELTSFIQNQYDIKIKVPEIIPKNFDTIDNLARYIRMKLKGDA